MQDKDELKEVLKGLGAEVEKPEEKVTRLTDTSNAEMMLESFGGKIRFDHRRNRWLIWKGHRWQPDDDGSITRLAIESARKRYQEAVLIGDTKEREQASKWAIQSENRQKVESTIALTKVLKPIADNGDNWDSDNFLLSCPNGIVNLKTGKLRKGKPEDRITMSTETEYKPRAKAPRWEQFIDEIFQGNKDLSKYVHKALGYSITGDTSEQAAFFNFGSGANGKSVMFKTIRTILGDYAHDAPASLLQRGYNKSTNDVAATECKRFLVSSEALSTSKIDEQRLKAWTGGDRVSARYLYSEFFDFEPTVKPWLFVNHKPRVDDDSFGFWRRVKLIPFNAIFTGKTDDKELYNKLKLEHEGILVWLVKGCLLWKKDGLEPAPAVVNEGTAEYQAENDELQDFLADRDQKEEFTKASELYRDYAIWCGTQNYTQKDILSKTAFGRRMTDKFQKVRKNNGIHYKGVGFGVESEAGCRVDPPISNTFPTTPRIGSLRKQTPNYTLRHKKTKNYSPLPVEAKKNQLDIKKRELEVKLQALEDTPLHKKKLKEYEDFIETNYK